MIDATSRYANMETATHIDEQGREQPYIKRRILPRAETLLKQTEVTVADGDRLDIIAQRAIGNPEQSWRICDANNAMNPKKLCSIRHSEFSRT